MLRIISTIHNIHLWPKGVLGVLVLFLVFELTFLVYLIPGNHHIKV